MNSAIRLFIFTTTLLATSLSFADTGLVSCKTNVTYSDGSQENFRTYVNVHKSINWDQSGYHYEGNRMNKFPSDSGRALFAMANVENDLLRIVYRGMTKLRDTSWAGGSEYEFYFKLDHTGKTVQLVDSSSSSDHIAIKIESCRTTISN
jgi:hypothetical protein